MMISITAKYAYRAGLPFFVRADTSLATQTQLPAPVPCGNFALIDASVPIAQVPTTWYIDVPKLPKKELPHAGIHIHLPKVGAKPWNAR